MPGEDQKGGKQHDTDAADRDGPGQVVAGPESLVSEDCHIVSLSGGSSFRVRSLRIAPE